MSRLPISTFIPIDSPAAVTRFVRYLSILKSRERYRPQDCLSAISSDTLRFQFCREALNNNIFSSSDTTISTFIKYAEQHKGKKKLNVHKMQKLSISEEWKQKLTEVQQPRKNGVQNEDKEISATKNESNRFANASTYSYEDLIIAKDIKASEFQVYEGYMKFADYILKSVRIHGIPKEVLKEIKCTFTIRKDLSRRKLEITTRKSKSKSAPKHKPSSQRHFIFEPATDLSKFLSEATQASIQLRHSSDFIDKPITEHGIFSLPWKNVFFRDGYMYLTHPNASGKSTINPFVFKHPKIHRSYSDFMPYIKKHATKLLVEGHDGKITRLLNFDAFSKIFPHLTSYSSCNKDEISIDKISPIVNKAYSLEEFRKARLINKSRFLAYLCKIHIPSYKIYYLLENVVHESAETTHDEYGYLFTIHEGFSYLIFLYENITDESRSSIVFAVSKRADFEPSVKFIARFLSSDEENKRLKLARRQLRFYKVVKAYDRITHTEYEEWRSKINNIINYGVSQNSFYL